MYYLVSFGCYNLIVMLLFGFDKLLAKMQAKRIPEKILISLAVLLGSYGAICGMVLFHHKISKPKFRYIISILFLMQSVLFALAFNRYFL